MERDLPKRMQTLQTELVQFYNDLPENLIWSTTNFKFWVSEHKGGVSQEMIRRSLEGGELICAITQVFLALHCMGTSSVIRLTAHLIVLH
jgi:hypothetical protein